MSNARRPPAARAATRRRLARRGCTATRRSSRGGVALTPSSDDGPASCMPARKCRQSRRIALLRGVARPSPAAIAAGCRAGTPPRRGGNLSRARRQGIAAGASARACSTQVLALIDDARFAHVVRAGQPRRSADRRPHRCARRPSADRDGPSRPPHRDEDAGLDRRFQDELARRRAESRKFRRPMSGSSRSTAPCSPKSTPAGPSAAR